MAYSVLRILPVNENGLLNMLLIFHQYLLIICIRCTFLRCCNVCNNCMFYMLCNCYIHNKLLLHLHFEVDFSQ